MSPGKKQVQKTHAFGHLLREYRKQMGLSQEEVATRWGHTREYVSLIERGKRKLDQIEQVYKLADILQIPHEKLDAIGRGVPQRMLQPQHPSEADDAILQALLTPALATVKLSWLIWYANTEDVIVNTLQKTIQELEKAIADRRGKLLYNALEVLAYAYEMIGMIEFDHLAFQQANSHFLEMYQLGEELRNPDILALSLIHQGDLLRRRGRCAQAVNRLKAAETHTSQSNNPYIEGIRAQNLARAYAEFGDKAAFLHEIHKAQEIAETTVTTLETMSSQFSLIGVLEEKAQGHTMLWESHKAIEIYTQTEKLRPVRTPRENGILTISKAQAYAYTADVEAGVDYALAGLKLAKQYGSYRHVCRVQRMYDRLNTTKLSKHPRVKDLQEALLTN